MLRHHPVKHGRASDARMPRVLDHCHVSLFEHGLLIANGHCHVSKELRVRHVDAAHRMWPTHTGRYSGRFENLQVRTGCI